MKRVLISTFLTSAILGAGAAYAYTKWGNNVAVSVYNKLVG